MSKIVNKVPEVFERLDRKLTEFTREGAKAVRDQIAKQGEEPKTGEIYGDHQASAPGEPWATDSGDLIRSFTLEEAILQTTLESELWRAAGLEEGIEDKEGNLMIEPRPSVRPAFEAVLPTLEAKLQEAVLEAKLTING